MKNVIGNWEFIVESYLRNALADASTVKIVWNDILREFMGYSKLRGEIDISRTVENRKLSGVVIKKDNKDAFLVMCKRYAEEFDKGDEERLVSELKLLEIPIGIFVCNKLYVCVYINGALRKMEIAFLKDNERGVEFLEIFERDSFNKQSALDFILDNVINEDVDEILEEMTSDFVRNLLMGYFSEYYDDAAVNTAFSRIKVKVEIDGNDADFENEDGERVDYDDEDFDDVDDDFFGESDYMDKKTAIMLFASKGYTAKAKMTTYSSQNSTVNIYWANPSVRLLKADWTLILNDKMGGKLYLFKIPANTFKVGDFKVRKDQMDKIDLQIAYGDLNFTDLRSGICFAPYMKDSISLK